jgi:processive 1,2-diacylglycerol beta-glucosyltransferase
LKNINIFHISEFGGHSKAAQNLKEAILYKNPKASVRSINGLGHFYPRSEKVIDFFYNKTIRHFPNVWGKAYDKKKVINALTPYRAIVHKFAFSKLERLFKTNHTDCCVATQAFPCGLIADYKKYKCLKMPLVAVVTDYHPHRFWVHPQVDRYIVACQDAKDVLIKHGVVEGRIRIVGIPISVKFLTAYPKQQVSNELGFANDLPSILIMGGGLGLGPFKTIAKDLDALEHNFQMIVVCGRNKNLHEWFLNNRKKFRKPIFSFGYTNHIHKIMDFSDIIITKAGGITISEALAKGLCIIVTNPIPGQEDRNVEYLLKQKAIVKVEDPRHSGAIVKDFLQDPKKIYSLRERAKEISFIDSSLRITDVIFELAS